MGAGASLEEQPGEGSTIRSAQRPPSTAGSARGSGRNTPVGSRPSSRRGSMSSGQTWRAAFRGTALQNSALRNMRATALGRKSAVTVTIDKTGFSLQHIRICEGQVISFEWDDPESQGYNVTQVTHDGSQYRPVPGGFNSGVVTKRGQFSQQFNLAGEYKFVSAGIRCTPLTVEVFVRKDVEAELNDHGFAPKIIRVDEGSAVTWRWTGCSIPHTVTELRFSHKRGSLVHREHYDKPIPTKAGSFRKEFPKPGIFYVQTEGATTGVMHTCMVHVRERQREVRIEVLDRSFSPPIAVIEEGDRVWWSWTKEKCKAIHCIYQIEPPPLNHPSDESYKPLKNGFKWPQPSKCGLMSCEFYEPGVYYFSDHTFDEAAEYVGTLIVKPKTREHYIEVSAEGFKPDMLYAEVGDRIWWTWDCDDNQLPRFSIREVDKVLSPLANRPGIEDENTGEGSYMDEALQNLKVQVGLETIQLGSIGAYTHCLADPDQRSVSSCSIISSAGPRNHTVHVTDTGFEPKVVTVHPNDRVWWVWQDGKQQHNIVQVSHQGTHIKNGFCSGAPSDCPSAFMTHFKSPGVYYYISSSLAKSFGAVVVSSQPKVHEIQVTAPSISPDPVILSVNDVVVWSFKGLRNHDVHQLTSVDQLLDIQMNSQHLQHPRRILSRLFKEKGVFHYTSKAFLKRTKSEANSDETRISTLLVDDPSDSMVVRINSQGFFPKNVNITQGQSVLWTWKEAGEEAHNIIHVNSPDSETPLSVIQGGKSFNSGRPVARNSFLYTFDEPGTYCVASQGAPGFAGTVTVLDHATKTATPYLVRSQHQGGTVDKHFAVKLACDTHDSQIYYTLDGSAPDLSRVVPKNHRGLWDAVRGRSELYRPEKGAILRQSGLVVLRAIAISRNCLNSDVMTSQRYWVLRGDEDNSSVSSAEPEPAPADNSASGQWWQSVPVIKGLFTSSGVMEVFWEPPPLGSSSLIKGYQLFLNGVSYCPVFPPSHNSVNVAGMAGGRMYEVILEVYPKDTMFLPHKSNKLMMKCPRTTGTGGPLISLEQTDKPDTLTIVWMAISTRECPIKGYRVYLNGQMCGSQVVPDRNSDRCKVVIEGCNLNTPYRLIVAAIADDGSSPKMSNELEITLPLEMSSIRLPPHELRAADDDLYREYIEVSEGTGYMQEQAPSDRPPGEPMTFDLTDQTLQTHSETDFPAKRKVIRMGRKVRTGFVQGISATCSGEEAGRLPYAILPAASLDILTLINQHIRTANKTDHVVHVNASDVMAISSPDLSSRMDSASVRGLGRSLSRESRIYVGFQRENIQDTNINDASSAAEGIGTLESRSTSLASGEEPELKFDNSSVSSGIEAKGKQAVARQEGSQKPDLEATELKVPVSELDRHGTYIIDPDSIQGDKADIKPEDEGFHGDRDDDSFLGDRDISEGIDSPREEADRSNQQQLPGTTIEANVQSPHHARTGDDQFLQENLEGTMKSLSETGKASQTLHTEQISQVTSVQVNSGEYIHECEERQNLHEEQSIDVSGNQSGEAGLKPERHSTKMACNSDVSGGKCQDNRENGDSIERNQNVPLNNSDTLNEDREDQSITSTQEQYDKLKGKIEEQIITNTQEQYDQLKERQEEQSITNTQEQNDEIMEKWEEKIITNTQEQCDERKEKVEEQSITNTQKYCHQLNGNREGQIMANTKEDESLTGEKSNGDDAKQKNNSENLKQDTIDEDANRFEHEKDPEVLATNGIRVQDERQIANSGRVDEDETWQQSNENTAHMDEMEGNASESQFVTEAASQMTHDSATEGIPVNMQTANGDTKSIGRNGDTEMFSNTVEQTEILTNENECLENDIPKTNKSAQLVDETDDTEPLEETARDQPQTGESEEYGQMLGDGYNYPPEEGYHPEGEGFHDYLASGAGLEGRVEEESDHGEEEEDEDYGNNNDMPVQPLQKQGSLGPSGFGTNSLGPQQMAPWSSSPGGPAQNQATQSSSQGPLQYAGAVPPPGVRQVIQQPPAAPSSGTLAEPQGRPPFVPRPPSTPPVSRPPVPQPVPESVHEGARFGGFAETGAGADPTCGFIDATQGPWKNRMKIMAEATRAVKRMDFGFFRPDEMATPPGQANAPPGGVVVEMDEDAESRDEAAAAAEGHPQRGKKKKKKRHGAAVVEVHDEAHLRYEAGRAPETAPMAMAAVPVIGQQTGQDQYLPEPIVTAQNRGNDRVLIRWHYGRSAEPLYRLMVNVVNVVGRKFAPGIGSDISFECLQAEGDDTVSAVQHCWNVTNGSEIEINGLRAGTAYTIFVVANYALINAKTPTELQAKSAPIRYTTIGPPPAPLLRPFGNDLYQVTLEWESQPGHEDVEVKGYRVLVDGRQLGDLLGKKTHKTTIDNLQPGRTIHVSVIAVTDHEVGSSEPSNVVKVTCPPTPPAPHVVHQPSYKRGSVTVGWEKPTGFQALPFGEDIIYYRVFVDNAWHGESRSSSDGNRKGYQYYLTDLQAGQTYDINIRSYAGQWKVDPKSEQVFCISESEQSNTLPVMCPAPPKSPCLRVEGMHTDGIDITWDMPQQFGDAQISGYQLMKDGKLYGSIMPPDVHSLRIKDISLGDRVELQILALTDHPVGRDGGNKTSGKELKLKRQDSKKDKKKDDEKSDGEEDETIGQKEDDSGEGRVTREAKMAGYQEIYIGDRYSACRPGPKLVVVYTGLVSPPAKVWCEKVTGHSAMIVWEPAQEPKAHFVEAENYQVTWWPKDQQQEAINSQSTKDDHLLVRGLKPNVVYSVVVEARKMQAYSAINGADLPADDGYGNMFILIGRSEQLAVRTTRPPPAPTNMGVVATTCNSLQVAWDPPVEMSSEILGVRVDAVAMSKPRHHVVAEVVPDATTALVKGLKEKTEYLLTVTLVTEEYFEQLPEDSEVRRKHMVPHDNPPPEDPWLPGSSMIAMTSGSEAPTDVHMVSTTINSVTLAWTPPVVYGSNRLTGTVVRWAEASTAKTLGAENQDSTLAHHKSIAAECNEATIDDLFPGVLYKVVVEAVVSVKTNLSGSTRDPEEEKRNRRTTHVVSRALLVRTRAPCEPPRPLVTAYSTTTIQLYWEKPLLYSVVGKDGKGNPKYLKMALEGYRLEINGKPHMNLQPTAQSCTLVKCRPGKTYQIVLVAITCTEDVKRERRKKEKDSNGNGNQEWDPSIYQHDNDESPSDALEVILPISQNGLLSEMNVNFAAPAHAEFESYSGNVHVEWGVQGHGEDIEQFLVTWRCDADGSLNRKVVNSATRVCSIPVNNDKSVYDVFLEPQYNRDRTGPQPQKCQVLIPGSPDQPEIWMRSTGREEFIIEWGEPRLYGVRVQGYQVYLNGKKVGNLLSSSHRKAVIPCKPRRTYKVNLAAVSADPNYQDSLLSNTLIVTVGVDAVRHIDGVPPEEPLDTDSSDLAVRVSKVTDTTIQLDWSTYNEPEGVVYYKVTWSSVAQPTERDVKLAAGERSCMLHKCYPGTNHFLRLYAMGREDRALDVSTQLTVQTCAPPDTPTVTVRACNFRYIAIQWEKPMTYGDTLVTGYKVYVNGVVEAVLGADQFSFSFTQGHWCREYAFQVQATAADEKLHSKPSEPLVVTWPGVQPPVLRRAPAVSGNSVKVIWDAPNMTDGTKIKLYKVICEDEQTQQPVQVIGPIHAQTTEAELHNLKAGSYNVYAEIHLHGTNDIVKTDVLKIQPTLTPDPPQISVTVIGLEERRQIEKVACDLINKRDRLINFLMNREVTQSLRITDQDQVLVKVTEDLAHVEDMLDDCLSSLNHYTGHLLAHVSWTCPQSHADMHVSGYKVLVDGKQYGTKLHAGIQNVRIKLGLQQASHRLSMVSVSDSPHATSVQSNVVELLTDPFQPFSFYSFLDANGPKSGGVYAPTLLTERKQHRIINQGLLKRHVPPPAATLLDVFEGEYRPLFPPSGPRGPTAILFWTKWNPASKRALGWFVRFARSQSSQYEFVAVACMAHDPSANDRHELVHLITENGWRDDKCVRHVTSHCAAPSTLASDYIKNRDGEVNGTSSKDVAELFGVMGVPMVAIVHPGDYIAWKGRFCAYDYIAYENFMRYVFAQAMGQSASVADPWDTTIEVDALDGVSKRGLTDSQLLIHRPTTNSRLNTGNTSTHHLNGNRPASAKKPLFKKTNKKPKDKLSIANRPYSATSPYSQKLVSEDTLGAPPRRRVKSGRMWNVNS